MTEYIANMLTKNMYMDGLIKESEESIYSYSIQLIVEKIIGFSAIYMIALFQGYFFETVLFTISLSNLIFRLTELHPITRQSLQTLRHSDKIISPKSLMIWILC